MNFPYFVFVNWKNEEETDYCFYTKKESFDWMEKLFKKGNARSIEIIFKGKRIFFGECVD